MQKNLGAQKTRGRVSAKWLRERGRQAHKKWQLDLARKKIGVHLTQPLKQMNKDSL